MNKVIKNVCIGLTGIVAGVSITLPVAYNLGKESARPIIATVSKVNNTNYAYFEKFEVTDKSGQQTRFYLVGKSIEDINSINDAQIHNEHYRIRDAIRGTDSDIADALETRQNTQYRK